MSENGQNRPKGYPLLFGRLQPFLNIRQKNLKVVNADAHSQKYVVFQNLWDEEEYEEKNDGTRMSDHAFAEINPLYDEYFRNKATQLNDTADDDVSSSQDLGDLIFALKTGESWEGNVKDGDVEMTDGMAKHEKLRRLSIADTHV